MAVAQEKADLANLEAEAQQEFATARLILSAGTDPDNAAARAMDRNSPF